MNLEFYFSFLKGERGIRTLGTNRLYNGLAIRRFRPLGHLSELNNFFICDNHMNNVTISKSLIYCIDISFDLQSVYANIQIIIYFIRKHYKDMFMIKIV